MDSTSPATHTRLEFTGSAGEYFRIWIVNLTLSLLTLGIYSAWAKVRKLKYLYGHTRLNEATFDYLADPLAILKGRIIAFAALIIYSLASRLNPALGLVLALIILLAMPWLVVRTLRFKARNSAYRGIRFDFTAPWSAAIKPFLAYSLLIPLTLGLASPFVIAEQRRFLYNHFQYGTTKFRLDVGVGGFYKVFMLASVPLLILLAGFAVVASLMPAPGTQPTPAQGAAILLLALIYVPVLIAMTTAIQTGLANLIWNNLSLGPHRFRSHLRFGRMLFINLTNSLAIVISLGFLFPWATIRTLRYRIQSLTVLPAGEMDEIIATEAASVRATGEELADFLDIDISL